MAVSVELLCETCRYEQIIKSSMWCTECQEGFCEECCRSHKDKKNFRNHNVMSTEDYQKTEKFNVNLKCPEHSKLFGFYCPTHDCVVCVVCVQSKHGGCENLRPIDEAAKGVKTEYQRPVHKLDNLQLKLRTNIKMGTQNSEVTSCLILPNKSFLIASWNKPTLNIFMENGSHDRDICVPYKPYDITKINDQSIAVSYGDEKCITIVNICNQRSNQTLENLCEEWIWGITYNDGKLYAVAYNEGIKVIDQDGSIIKTIGIYDQAKSTFKVTTQKDKIYYSVINGSVHCVNMEGTEIWTCQDDRLQSLDSPAIAVDNYGITFAAGYDNNLLLAISPDGKQQKVLLTSSDGLQKPNAVYYDKDSQRLLVCNGHNEHAALYDVIY